MQSLQCISCCTKIDMPVTSLKAYGELGERALTVNHLHVTVIAHVFLSVLRASFSRDGQKI